MNLALFLAGWTAFSIAIAALVGAITARLQAKERRRQLSERDVRDQLRGERNIFVIAGGKR